LLFLGCNSNCFECTSLTKCTKCINGYSLLGDICIKSPKVLSSSQNSIIKLDLSKHYANSNKKYIGLSLNLWAKFDEVSSLIEKPIILIDPFLLNYNRTNLNGNYFLRNSKFNYMFSYSNFFPSLINYTLINNREYYETNWIPYSIGILFSEDFQNFFIQISINNENPRSLIVYQKEIPQTIILFNHFSKIFYRYLKIWDRYISSEELNSINYK
jgi:hypothetical protein